MQDLFKCLSDIDWIYSNHIGVKKKVLFGSEEIESNITQLAYAELELGKEIGPHSHDSMEEVFFLTEGQCEFNIHGTTILVKEQTAIRIPSKQEHSLRAITNCSFVYFGVAI